MKKISKIILSLVLVAAVSLTSFAVVKSDKLGNLKKQKESVAARKKEIKKKKKEAEEYISGVDKQLTNISTQIYENGQKLTKTPNLLIINPINLE